jgi:alcohol dehydrogenase
MRAVQYSAYGETPTVVTTADPHCPEDGAVIRVGATGVCRSDWHAWTGHDPVTLPHVPGHEYAGVVAAVGPLVTRVRVGERVTVPFVCGCGTCSFCLAGDAQVCPQQTQPGFTGPGSFAELVAVRAADLNVVPLPDDLDLVTAASLGCRFATAYRALTTHGRVGPGDWVAVHGCGGVGLSAVMLAAALGARVVAVDVSPAALALAADLGATVMVDGTGDVAREIASLTDGGAHVSLDAVGSPATAMASVHCLRPRGRHVQVGLLLGLEATPPLPMDRVVSRELEIHGSHGMPARDYPALLRLVTSGAVQPERLVSRVIALDEAGAALVALGDPPTSAGMTVVRL